MRVWEDSTSLDRYGKSYGAAKGMSGSGDDDWVRAERELRKGLTKMSRLALGAIEKGLRSKNEHVQIGCAKYYIDKFVPTQTKTQSEINASILTPASFLDAMEGEDCPSKSE